MPAESIKNLKTQQPCQDVKNKDEAINDFLKRIKMYEKAYEPLDDEKDEDLSYIKIINVGKRFLVNNVKDHIQSKIVYFLMNINVNNNRTIYLTRHGESLFNRLGKIGGDAGLSSRGVEYAVQLGDWVNANILDQNNDKIDQKFENENSKLKVWVSELQRTHETAAFINHPVESWKNLNEINAGICEGMTYEEIEINCPDVHRNRDKDKYNFRYPMGESYYDLCQRLEPVIMELEKRDNVLLICHQAVMRCLLAYFREEKYQDLPYLNCPLHTLVKLVPKAYGCEVSSERFDVESVDTHRPQPSIPNSVSGFEEELER